jgi:hypothetical protein
MGRTRLALTAIALAFASLGAPAAHAAQAAPPGGSVAKCSGAPCDELCWVYTDVVFGWDCPVQ